MDKLKLQTVYVPVDQRNNTFRGLERIHKGGIGYMHKQDNRIVLTPGELRTFSEELSLLAIQVMPMTQEYLDKMISEFLKSKGIEI